VKLLPLRKGQWQNSWHEGCGGIQKLATDFTQILTDFNENRFAR
jgi:hypothetical protein